jgi:hypothetical protein
MMVDGTFMGGLLMEKLDGGMNIDEGRRLHL